MASTSITDYQVLIGGGVTLDRNSSTSTPASFADTFIWPSDLHVPRGSPRPLPMFHIHPFADPTFDPFLNGRFLIFDMNFSQSLTRNHFEVFDFDSAIAAGIPDDRKVEFRITMKSGRARFSDIVIWYQNNR